jgi:hypothetical protein
MSTREDVAIALFSLISTATGNVVGLKTSSRRLRSLEEVNPGEMPAIFLDQGDEAYERKPDGLFGPPKRTMDFVVMLYTADNQAPSVLPIIQLNTMVDAIEAAMLPTGADLAVNRQTLGGIVFSARIMGTVRNFANVASDGKSMSVLQISVVRP